MIKIFGIFKKKFVKSAHIYEVCVCGSKKIELIPNGQIFGEKAYSVICRDCGELVNYKSRHNNIKYFRAAWNKHMINKGASN